MLLNFAEHDKRFEWASLFRCHIHPKTTTNYTYTITNFALKSYILLTKLIMPSEHKNRWELSMKADLQNILIPEPQHR